MLGTFLGIEDPFVWIAYLLCILSALFCVAYGATHWNKGEEPVEAADQHWATEEDKVEKDL